MATRARPSRPRPDRTVSRRSRGRAWTRFLGGFGVRLALVLTVGSLSTGLVGVAGAGTWVWDQDENGLDDRMETVQVDGYRFSFENADTLARQRFQVSRIVGGLLYGVYVRYASPPSPADLGALALIGLPVRHRIESLPAVRVTGTFAQAILARGLPGVVRVEVVPILYPGAHDGSAAIGVRDPSERVFPTWAGPGGETETGEGVVIAFLDSGVNDAADGGYPGHESLAGRFVGGAAFTLGDSLLDTSRDGTTNPKDESGSLTTAHGTHVAAIALGAGGASGLARGVAPGARFVDVKVLGLTGLGTGVAEALDWCISNRDRDWGDPDPEATGIDVINVSLSSLDESDGQDLASQLASRAVDLGIVVVASMGNDSRTGMAPSPAAGDGVIAVGAWDVQRSGEPGDDVYPLFNNYGPRAGDGDLDLTDEEKPDLLAPGVGVLSADGDLGSDGTRYRRASGTSMAAPFVSGTAALLLSAFPGLEPGQVAHLLRSTARRNLTGLPSGVGRTTPGWLSPRGFGVLDVYAALLEARDPERTQVRRFTLTSLDTVLAAEVWTQRERGATHVVFERAPDLSGVPGAFAPFDSIALAGDSTLADGTNLSAHSRTWPVPPSEWHVPFWYRTAYTEAGARFSGPARRFVPAAGPRVATLRVTIVHNAYDSDIDAVVRAGAQANAPSFAVPASQSAVSTDWVDGLSTTGNVALSFEIPVTAGTVDPLLPPSPSAPWYLDVTEGGFLNRSGRVTHFDLTLHEPGGDVVYEGGPLPAWTVQGQTTTVRIPVGIVDAPAFESVAGLAILPNPAPQGAVLRFRSPVPIAGPIAIHDARGRRVAEVPAGPDDGAAGTDRSFLPVDGAGRSLAPGLYFARLGPLRASFVVLPVKR